MDHTKRRVPTAQTDECTLLFPHSWSHRRPRQEGTHGPATPFMCKYLSPWAMYAQIHALVLRRKAFPVSIDSRFRKQHAELYWNLCMYVVFGREARKFNRISHFNALRCQKYSNTNTGTPTLKHRYTFEGVFRSDFS